MRTHAYVCAGMKGGDLLGVLPIFLQAHRQHGSRPHVIVAQQYQPILERAPYVTPVTWEGHWGDLRGALRFAKRSFDRVTCLSTFGEDFPMQKRLPGFQLDQWDRAGMLEQWDSLSFELNRAEPPIIGIKGARHILFGDYSESSPFPQADELAAELKAQFPEHEIIRLSSLRLDNPMDMLWVFDLAEALVTIETMFCHLSKFSSVPTVALVTDKPSRWHGSSYSKRFRLHVRYSDYEQRKVDIIHAVRDAVNKVDAPLIEPMPQAPPLAYNPSLLRVGDKLWTSWRWHPDPTSWRTELVIHDGEKARPVVVEGFEKFSVEDGRLFLFQGKPHLSFTLSRSPMPGQNFGPCVTAYAALEPIEEGFLISDFVRPQFGKNDFTGTEKNLVFVEKNGRLYCIWQCSPEQLVLGLDGNRVISQHRSPCPECSYGHPRGGTQPVPYQGNWLRFVHVHQRNEKSDQWWTYHLAAVVMEPEPPFKVVKISERPILIGNEQYFPNHRYWKPRCILPFGAVEEGDGWRVAIGVNDSLCATVKLAEKDLHL